MHASHVDSPAVNAKECVSCYRWEHLTEIEKQPMIQNSDIYTEHLNDFQEIDSWQVNCSFGCSSFFFILLLNLEFRTINQASRTDVDFLRTLLCLFMVLCCSRIISHLISLEPHKTLVCVCSYYSENDLLSAFSPLIKSIQIRDLADSFKGAVCYIDS